MQDANSCQVVQGTGSKSSDFGVGPDLQLVGGFIGSDEVSAALSAHGGLVCPVLTTARAA